MGKTTPIRAETMDAVIKYVFGPRKLSPEEAGKKAVISSATSSRIVTAYRLANGNVDELVEFTARNSVSADTIAWAFECYGEEVPTDFMARVQAKKRGDLFEEKPEEKTEEKPKQDTNAENLMVLCGRINAIGKALSDCLTEETAGKLAGRLVDAIGALVKESSANADNILAEMQKQTELLQKIVYNTKKLNKGGQL